jgi:hypothetical protein
LEQLYYAIGIEVFIIVWFRLTEVTNAGQKLDEQERNYYWRRGFDAAGGDPHEGASDQNASRYGKGGTGWNCI